MTTTIVGVGNIGSALARHLVGGDETVVVAAKDSRDHDRRLIKAAGFEPLKVGGVAAAVRIEMPGGDLYQSGLNGELLDLEQARAAIDPKEVPV